MKNTYLWVIVILIVLAGLFWFMSNSSASMTVSLSTQNASGMSGTAKLTDMGDGSTFVELSLVGAPEGVSQPAHIHTGSCANIGGVVYPLEFPVNGVSETTLNVSLENILSQLPLALNVHKSPEEAGIYVACGDLSAL